jgi:hypothetical protein
LFASHDFSSWQQQGNANWHISNRQVVMNQGSGWLVGRLPLANSEISITYWADAQSQAILYIRCADTRAINRQTAYRIALANPVMTETHARWNTIKVVTQDAYYNVWLNDLKIIDNRFDPRFSSGPVALHAVQGPLRISAFNVTIPGRW